MNALTIYESLSKVGEEREYRIHAEQVYFNEITVGSLEKMKLILHRLASEGLIEWVTWYEPQNLDWVIKIKRIK
jgi:hypothetical protein